MGVRSTAILLLLLDTGMRRAELEGLEIEDVDLDAVLTCPPQTLQVE